MKEKLLKEICEAIDHTKATLNKGCEFDLSFVLENIDHNHAWQLRNFTKGHTGGHERYFKALVNGYEPILTNEEQVTELLCEYFTVNDVALWVIEKIKEIYSKEGERQ